MAGLQISDIVKSFGTTTAVDGLTMTVERGSLLGFLGPNGAGKTTTMRAIMGMVRLDRGSISWDGSPIDASVRQRIGYMPQERGLYARMKVREQVIYFARLAGLDQARAAERADYWLDRVEVAHRADDDVQDLSGGNQQRVQLAVALVHDPDLLVLDEPFAGLDPVATENLRSLIAERARAGTAVLFSSHQLDIVSELTDEVVIVAKGRRAASGTITDLRDRSDHRVLRVRWAEPLVGWQPVVGRLASFDGTEAVVELPASVDADTAVRQAIEAGPVREVSLEPPPLADLFADVIAGDAGLA